MTSAWLKGLQDGISHFAADYIYVDVHASRTRLPDRGAEIGFATIVYSDIEAEFLSNELDFFIGAGDAYDSAAR